jgi:2,4-dienoyl-CoA reductase-like NADH-dependent reductase (Old Yellow Enzyme family)
MSVMFSPSMIRGIEIRNRFVHSATYEGLCPDGGEVTDDLVNRYDNLAKGGVGLIIPGYMNVSADGKGLPFQTGIYRDELVPGLKRLADTAHEHGAKIFFQLAHAGRQTDPNIIGSKPMGPSNKRIDPRYFFWPRQMTQNDIRRVIDDFGKAAQRAAQAGADGVQLHAAHGYLINQFLSPFTNFRKDDWGGSAENNFRFLKEVYLEVRRNLPDHMALAVKLNSHDYTPRPGIMPDLAAQYAEWLAELGIDAIEISSGNGTWTFMTVCRGDVPVPEILQSVPGWQKPLAKIMLNRLVGQYDVSESYNLDLARQVKPSMPDVPLILVGGNRSLSNMDQIVSNGEADFISMSRPLIREPFLVKRFQEGKTDRASCTSCNRCFAAMPNNLPIRCYAQGYPG